jgi:hypothetical protein
MGKTRKHDMLHRTQLRGYGFVYLGMIVAMDIAPPTGYGIVVKIAFVIVEFYTFRLFNKNGR